MSGDDRFTDAAGRLKQLRSEIAALSDGVKATQRAVSDAIANGEEARRILGAARARVAEAEQELAQATAARYQAEAASGPRTDPAAAKQETTAREALHRARQELRTAELGSEEADRVRELLREHLNEVEQEARSQKSGAKSKAASEILAHVKASWADVRLLLAELSAIGAIPEGDNPVATNVADDAAAAFEQRMGWAGSVSEGRALERERASILGGR